MHIGREGKTSKSGSIHIPAKVTYKPILTGMKFTVNCNTHLHFKYLGSIIATNLRDEIDVATRIAIARFQITSMIELFNWQDVSVAMEAIMHRSISLNAVLWGCETWALKEKDNINLEAFHHTVIRRILGISTRRVIEERATTKMVKSKLMGIPPIHYFITRCAFKYIAKTVSIPRENTLQKKFMPAYCYTPIPLVCQLCTCRDSFSEAIRIVLHATPCDGEFKYWHDTITEAEVFDPRISNWWKSQFLEPKPKIYDAST
jgi:hypothetical protein